MAIFEVEEENFNTLLAEELDKGNFIILKFGAELCDACQALDFELEELDDNGENISIFNIDFHECESLSNIYEIQMLPTIVIYNNKNEILISHEGVMLCQDMLDIIHS